MKNKNKNDVITRDATLTVNEQSNIVDVIFATGETIRRYDFWNETSIDESLEMTAEACDLSRLNNGASVCNNHNTYDLSAIIGTVVKNSAKIENGRGLCQIELSQRDEISGIVNDIKSGIIKNISIGYRILEHQTTTNNTSNIKEILATKWMPHEVSFVCVPADPHAQTNRNLNEETEQMSVKDVEKIDLDKIRSEIKTESDIAAIAEQERVLSIIKRCNTAQISDEKQREFIKSGKTLDQINEFIIDEYEKKSASENEKINRSFVTSATNNDNLVRDLSDALIARSTCKESDNENAKHFKHYSLLDVASRMLSTGTSTLEMSKSDLAARALTTSDFSLLLANVANKTLQRAYQQSAQTFRPIVREVPINDFKPVQRTRLGDAPNMPVVPEAGEFTYGSVGEEAETYKLATYGRIIPLTRQAIINDDLSGFTRLAQMQGNAAARVESDLVWGILIANGNMSDNKKLFSAGHSNLKIGANKIDEAGISSVRKAFRNVKSVDGELLDLNARYIITNTDMQTQAEKFISTNLLANQVSDINVFSGQFIVISEPRLDNIDKKPFFMFADPDYIDVIELAYLSGTQGVYLESKENFNTDVMEYKARLDVAAAAIDWRGMYQINTAT